MFELVRVNGTCVVCADIEGTKIGIKQRYVPAYEKALIHVGLRENSRALTELEEAYKEDSYWMFNLSYEPRLDPLRSDPRFADLLRRINLPQKLH
jgi:hypothetical protein